MIFLCFLCSFTLLFFCTCVLSFFLGIRKKLGYCLSFSVSFSFFLSLFHSFSCSIVLLLELWGFKDAAINYNHKGFLPFTHFIGKFKCRLKLQCTKTSVRSKISIVQCIKLKELSQH